MGAVTVKFVKGGGEEGEFRFSDSFVIGRSRECDLQIKDTAVSRTHLKVELVEGRWWLRDLGSGNGTFLNRERIGEMPLPDEAIVELGQGGPQLALTLERQTREIQPDEEPVTVTVPLLQPKPPTAAKPDLSSETQIMRHYFSKGGSDGAGEQTMMFRRAFDRAHKKSSRKFCYAISAALLLLMLAGSVIFVQKQKLQKLRSTAENIFYVMKTLEVQIGNLEQVVMLTADPLQVEELKAKREKVRNLEQEYGTFVQELDVYGKVSPEDRVIMKVARVFGECEVNIPQGFFDEVKRYIALWKSSDRLQSALDRAHQKGYSQLIVQVLKDHDLPPQFFFLALQESNFNERAVGPATRYGNAKGMWQFIAPTAKDFGLRIGPLHDKPVYDPLDDRFEPAKATLAATRYIRDLNNTEAQASGLLVMASYNWGEGNVLKIIDQMPPNPRERNFWRLLTIREIPRETYDYVFSIFSAAVICEDPKLFGFNGNCPTFGNAGSSGEAGGIASAYAKAPADRP